MFLFSIINWHIILFLQSAKCIGQYDSFYNSVKVSNIISLWNTFINLNFLSIGVKISLLIIYLSFIFSSPFSYCSIHSHSQNLETSFLLAPQVYILWNLNNTPISLLYQFSLYNRDSICIQATRMWSKNFIWDIPWVII